MLRPVASKACQPKHSEHRQPKPTPHKRTQLTLDHPCGAWPRFSAPSPCTVCVNLCSVCAAAIAQHETWLNRNRYLIVAAFRGISATNKRSTVNKSRCVWCACALLHARPAEIANKTTDCSVARYPRCVGAPLNKRRRTTRTTKQQTNKQKQHTIINHTVVCAERGSLYSHRESRIPHN